MNDYSKLADWIARSDDIAIVCHVFPDGDTLGTGLAMKEALELMGKRACVICQDEMPRMYDFMPGIEEVTGPEKIPFAPRSVLFVDVSDESRAGNCLLSDVARRAVLDHHGTNPGFGEVNAIDGSASAAGVMAVELLDSIGLALTPTLAEKLYVAIASDTGNFSFPNTDGRTLRAGAACIDAGASPDRVTRYLYRLRSVPRVRLLGKALDNMQLRSGGRIAVFMVSRADMRDAGASEADTEGIVNYGTETEGVSAAILLREVKSGDIKVSLRSNGELDVSEIALLHGGGGHQKAAGCTMAQSLAECADILTREIEQIL